MSNPVDLMSVAEAEDGTFYITVRDGDGTNVRPHTRGWRFADEEKAHDHLDSLMEMYEDQQDQYLEENSYAIRQSELYEQWRVEY